MTPSDPGALVPLPVRKPKSSRGTSAGPTHGASAAAGRRESRPAAPDFRGRAAVVTLGCAKNQVDSEVMLGVLRKSGFEIVSDMAEADVAVVNTCGFLESAVKESIDAVLDAASYKEKGRLRKLFVAGCMVERYRDELVASLPEADGFLSVDDVTKVGDLASGAPSDTLLSAGRPYFLYDDTTPRELSARPHTAYLKVSEGCDRPCAFCIIPRLRGALRSRDPGSVLREATALAERGVRELNLVGQDLTDYGKDLPGRPSLADLLVSLDREKVVDRVRLLYAYPLGVDRRLLDVIVASPSVCDYLDIPLQHSSEPVLRRMRRPLGRFSPRRIVEFIRDAAPSVALRTTFIVGFPGETEEDVADLESFVADGHFTSVGVFTYSREAGTPAGDMPDQIPEKVKRERRARVMKVQQRVVRARSSRLVGSVVEVLIDGPHEETDMLLVGRTRWQAPEVDGCVIVNDAESPEAESRGDGAGPAAPGALRLVEVTGTAGYDLVGKLLDGRPDGHADRGRPGAGEPHTTRPAAAGAGDAGLLNVSYARRSPPVAP